MLIVLALIAALGPGGGWLGLSRRARWAAVGLLWGGWMLRLLLSDGTPQARVGWAALAVAVLAVLAYRAWLAGLRRKAAARSAEAAASGPASGPLDAAELARYSRHILLHEIGGPGQRRLKAARVLVVGAGGLGAPVLQYLAAAGVGTLGFIDDDVVEPSNLQRQVIHAEAAVGRPKVLSAAGTLAAQNPHVRLRPYDFRLTDGNAPALFGGYDLILDGSDSFDTRALVNRAAVATGRPLISGALTQWEGQVTLLDPARGAPCYACLFPERPAPGMVPTCAEAGVAGPLPGVIGTIMALEAVKELTGAGESLRGRLLLWDGLSGEQRAIRVRPRPGCPVCGAVQEQVDGSPGSQARGGPPPAPRRDEAGAGPGRSAGSG